MGNVSNLYSKMQSDYTSKIKTLGLKGLRVLNRINPVMGIKVATGYIPLNATNVESSVRRGSAKVKVFTLTEENSGLTQPAIYVGEALRGISPLIARTETVILDIFDTNFSLRNNHLLDKNLNVIGECGINDKRMPIYKQILAKTTKRSGSVAYLSNTDPMNYYHWMCRTLPLIRIYQKFFDLSEIDSFYLGNFPLQDFHLESLAKVGITPDRLVQNACTADRLLVAISSRAKHFESAPMNESSYFYTRSLFQNELTDFPKSKVRRFYVKRGNVKRRKVINEAEVITLLEQYGFESITMDGRTIGEQAQLFHQAEAVIAAHGAALTNLLFVPPGAKIIELIPYGYLNNCYYAMANYAKAEYFYLQGEKIQQSNDADKHSLDILVDIKKLNKLCQLAFLNKSNIIST